MYFLSVGSEVRRLFTECCLIFFLSLYDCHRLVVKYSVGDCRKMLLRRKERWRRRNRRWRP